MLWWGVQGILWLLVVVEEGILGVEGVQVMRVQGQRLGMVERAVRGLLQRREGAGLHRRIGIVVELFLRWLLHGARTGTTGWPREGALPVHLIQKCGTCGTVTGSS